MTNGGAGVANFQINKIGTSFKGVMAYLMHDRPDAEGGAYRDTSDRVAWSEVLNMAAASGPHSATRIMIDTAQNADRIKIEAGQKITKKATAGPVFHMSIQWRGDELGHDDRDSMEEAARETLRVLKLDHLQAVIVAHRDTKNPHLHIVVNRVDPETGLYAKIDPNLVRKVNKWANDWEHQNGLIVSPNRARRFEEAAQAQEQRRRPTDPAELKAHNERRKEERRRRKEEAAKAEAAQFGPDQKPRDRQNGDMVPGDRQAADRQRQAQPKTPAPGQILKDLSDAQKARHKAEWQAWGEEARRGRQAIYRQADAARRDAAAAFKAGTKGDWAQHFRDERTRIQIFEKRERSLGGIFRNALDAARVQAKRISGGSNVFGLALSNILSGAARRDAFAMVAEGRSALMRSHMQARKADALSSIDTAKRTALQTHSRKVSDDRAALIERQNAETAKIREAWRQHYAQKAQQQPGDTYRRREPDPPRKPDPRPAPRPVIAPTPEKITPAFTARAAGWLQGRAADTVAAVQHVAADIEQRQQEKRRERFVRETLKEADARIARAAGNADQPPPPRAPDPRPAHQSAPPTTAEAEAKGMASANQYRAGSERRQTPPASKPSPTPSIIEKGDAMKPPTRTWAEIEEDRSIMRGTAPTNPENMRRREEDAQADKPTDMFAKYRRAAAERPRGPKPERPRGPRLKP